MGSEMDLDLLEGVDDRTGDDKECNIYLKYKNRGRGGFFGLTDVNGYEGIPQNLVLNIIGWVIMILIFSVLRKKAWNYGRIALVQRNERNKAQAKWTEMFYGGSSATPSGADAAGGAVPLPDDLLEVSPNGSTEQSPAPSATTQLLLAPQTNSGNSSTNNGATNNAADVIIERELNHNHSHHGHNRIVHADSSVTMDTGYFSWIRIVFTLTDEQYFEKCGFDCCMYLSFQRHLIFLASIVTLTSLVIVLPINYQGTPLTDQQTQFNQTTIINLKHNPRLLWVHVILAITFLFLSIAVMRHFSRALKFVDDDPAVCRSIMIVGIGKKFCLEEKLRRHFEEIYPDVEISELNFAYDISQLQNVEFLRQSAHMAKAYWEEFQQKNHYRPTMRPYTCGAICCCVESCCCPSTDAIDYYSNEELQYDREVHCERTRALTKPLGIAFVTFKTVDMAERVVNDYRFTAKLLQQSPMSKFSRKLKSKQWTVKFAPLPDDVYWENLTYGLKAWYLKAFLVNITLAIVIIFYTTPAFLMNTFLPLLNTTGMSNKSANDTSDDSETTQSTLSGLLIDTIPTLLLWIAAVTLPSLVSVSDKIVGFWTRTAENRSRMIKIFSFLLFMVVILPSVGLTSLTALLNEQKSFDLKWECIFSKDNGALFVNYVCTSTFLGTASELMRLPELLIYCIKLCFSRSAAELAAIRKSVLWDFQIGSQYAWMMLNFAIFSVFSVIFPVITPFGLVYLVFKHYVDRYNIYFAYGPTKVEKEVHGTAINFVVVCMFVLQINLLAYVTTQNSDTDTMNPAKGLKVFSVVGFCITAALFISQIFFNMCANFSPILYRRMSQEGDLATTVDGETPSVRTQISNNSTVPFIRKTTDTFDLNPSDPNSKMRILHISSSVEETITRAEQGSGRYYPNILQRYLQPMPEKHPTPSPSIHSVTSQPGRMHNGIMPNRSSVVTTVVVNEQTGATVERVPKVKKPGPKHTV